MSAHSEAIERRVDGGAPGAAAPSAVGGWGHRLMFVLLMLAAFALFAPAILLPLLQDYADVLAEEQRLKARVTEEEFEVERAHRLITAFSSDPLVNEQLAKIDLNYRRPGEQAIVVPPEFIRPVLVAGQSVEEPPAMAEWLTPPHWPAWSRRAEAWARQRDLVHLFLDPSTRAVLLLMSGGLTIAAFVLYAPRGTSAK